ncbi:MAG: exonuclease SbcCD subunit D [Bacteriovoracaceae bacterium]|nr:exonuclease SbcCD subunit D [Bacteriovoracaceae bacterium]
MKLLHTSDWHLGKKLFRMERLPEQEKFLQELVSIIKNEKIDHLLVAGDIFDVPQPPHKALKLFYDFVSELTSLGTTHLWLIGGNHDSATLLDAPTSLINKELIHFYGGIREDESEHWAKLPFKDSKDFLSLCLLPYFRHHEIAPWKRDEDVTQDDWTQKIIKRFLGTNPHPETKAKILLAHHLFGLYEAAGSEQALALSGLDSIPLEWISQFDYAALGHIHKPQTLKKEKPLVRYSGSPIAMRFSETAPKTLNLLEFENSGRFHHSLIPLTTHRTLASLHVTEESWSSALENLKQSELPAACEMYIKLKAPVAGLMEEIRLKADELGLNLLGIVPEFMNEKKEDSTESWTELLSLTPEELFSSFYLTKFPEEEAVPTELTQDMKLLWEEARHAPPSA